MIDPEDKGIDDQINKLSNEEAKKYLDEKEKQAIDPLEGKLFFDHEIDTKVTSLITGSKLELNRAELAPSLKAILERDDVFTEVADSAIIYPAVSIAGAFLRDKVIIEGSASDLHLNTWLIPSGPSGCGKSTGAKPALAIIREFEEPLKEKYVDDLKHYQKEMKKYYKAEEKGEEMEEPKAPVSQMISFPMVTSLERVLEMLAEGTSYGLMATEEEISVMFKKVKEVPGLKELFISLYGGNLPNNLVSFRNNKNLNLPNKALLSIFGPATTRSLSKILSDEDMGSGLFARCNLVDCDNHKPQVAFPRRNKKLLNLDPIKPKLKDMWNFGLCSSKIVRLSLNEEALNYYETVIFEEFQVKKNKFRNNDIIISCLDRYWRETLFKLAGILHCLENDFRNHSSVSMETLAQAQAMTQFVEDSMHKFLNQHRLSSVFDMATKIISKLRSEDSFEMKENSLANSLRGYDRNRRQFYIALEKCTYSGKLKISSKYVLAS